MKPLIYSVRYGLTGLAAVLGLLAGRPAAAHPMGNFSINHYARFESRADRLTVRYILDLAEIPTVAERRAMDRDGNGVISDAERSAYLRAKAPVLRDGLVITIDHKPAHLDVRPIRLELQPGAAGLDTLRITLDLVAPLPDHRPGARYRVEYHDTNFAERTGWKEIVALAGPGTTIDHSSAASADQSRELTAYLSDPSVAPPQQVEAGFTVITKPASDMVAAPIKPSSPQDRSISRSRTPENAFTRAIAHRALTPGLMLAGLLLAFGFGAVHALAPGHGKTLVAAYLVGTRGTFRHAAVLGVVVTITHTFGVFVLGLVTLFASRYVVPERLYPMLSIMSGLTVCGVGIALLYRRARGRPGGHHHGHDEHAHHHHDHHHHDHHGHHHHVPEGPVTAKTLVALGMSGGIVPCPSALVVLLSAIALHRVLYGMLLISAFSVGLASVLIVIGLMVVSTRHWFTRRLPSGGILLRYLPAASAAVIILIGLGLVVQALGPAVR